MPQHHDPAFPTGFVYIRLKPKHPKLGLKQGIHLERLHALGQVWVGGNGIQTIPRWYKVAPEVAQALAYFKQRQNDPNSLPAFDFVFDDEVKLQIDTAEAYHRNSLMGVAQLAPLPSGQMAAMQPMGPHTLPAPRTTVEQLQSQDQRTVTADTLRGHLGPPSLIPGAQNFMQAAIATSPHLMPGMVPPGQLPAHSPAPQMPPVATHQPPIQPGVIVPQAAPAPAPAPAPTTPTPVPQAVPLHPQPQQPQQPLQPQPAPASVIPLNPHPAPLQGAVDPNALAIQMAGQLAMSQMPQAAPVPLAPEHRAPPIAGHGRAQALRGPVADAEAVILAKATEGTVEAAVQPAAIQQPAQAPASAPLSAVSEAAETAAFGEVGEELGAEGGIPQVAMASGDEIARVEQAAQVATATPAAPVVQIQPSMPAAPMVPPPGLKL